jgi:hypothetical protein
VSQVANDFFEAVRFGGKGGSTNASLESFNKKAEELPAAMPSNEKKILFRVHLCLSKSLTM